MAKREYCRSFLFQRVHTSSFCLQWHRYGNLVVHTEFQWKNLMTFSLSGRKSNGTNRWHLLIRKFIRIDDISSSTLDLAWILELRYPRIRGTESQCSPVENPQVMNSGCRKLRGAYLIRQSWDSMLIDIARQKIESCGTFSRHTIRWPAVCIFEDHELRGELIG